MARRQTHRYRCWYRTGCAGRFIDVLDGIVARKTGQTSDFGALLDAGLDKAVTAIILYEIKSKNLAPTEIIAAITAFNGINAVASAKTIVEAGDETVRPEISGKLALALETSSLLAHLVGSRLETTGQSQLARVARGIGNLAFAVSLPFAVKSTLSYIERARQSKRRNDK
ncbi:MAG: CDP-alcohol phosphatidyltransferase family protein [Candidatus Saccharimonas sp.]